jgi:hypothetical protein
MKLPEPLIRSKKMRRIIWISLLMLSLAAILGACSSKTPSSTGTITSTPVLTTPEVKLDQYQLAYRLLSTYPDYFWCDPDIYPIAREGVEQSNAIAQFPTIQANQLEFAAILTQLNLTLQTNYSDSDKLAIYREHKKITLAVSVTAADDGYSFTIRTGQNQGKTIQGTISAFGVIKVLKEDTSFNTCPICLAKGTLIDTPEGSIQVENLRIGQIVWSKDGEGNRVAEPILKISRTLVPADFQILKITLGDGRSVTASPGHPTSDMKALSEYRVGDTLDSGRILSVQLLTYGSDATYDILPGGTSGLYWANNILLMSTLSSP